MDRGGLGTPDLPWPAAGGPRLRTGAPILVDAGMMVYQAIVGDPVALRVVSFFAMGIPALAAGAAWSACAAIHRGEVRS